MLEAEALRDYLYTKMRGVRESGHDVAHTPDGPAVAWSSTDDEVLALLTDIRDSLRRVESRLGGRA